MRAGGRMANENDILNKASDLLGSRRYAEAKRLLLDAVIKSPRNAEAHALLAHAALSLKQYEEAKPFIEKALFLSRMNITALIAEGYRNLIMGNVEEALRAYVRVLEIDPRNLTAKTNIDRIRTFDSIDEEIPFLKPHDYLRPPFVSVDIRRFPRAYLIAGAALVLAVILGIAFAVNQRQIIRAITHIAPADKNDPIAEKLKDIYLFDGIQSNTSSRGGDLSPRDVIKRFNEAKSLLASGHINRALVIINGIEREKVHPYLQDRFRLLTNFIKSPDYAEFDDNVSYETVMKDAALYDGAYIIWQGTVNEIDDDGRMTVFSLLIKKPSASKVLGIVRVAIEGAYSLRANERVEIYGRITGMEKKTARLSIEANLLKHIP